MEQIKVSHLTFSYDSNSAFSLRDVSFSVKQGEFLLIIGESGCGKTTLLRHLKMEHRPQGTRSSDSRVYINGRELEQLEEREHASLVGFVGQNVDSAQVTDKVWHELAFGLESLGYPQDVMQRRVAEMTAFFGLEGIYHEKLCSLSGGQKQLVNLASVMVMEPEILILDEPTSQLDPIAAEEFFRMIKKIHRELGITILMTEHRLEEVYSLCDRVLVLEQGRLWGDGTPEQIAKKLYESGHSLYKALPTATRMYFALEEKEVNEILPQTVNEGRRWLENYCKNHAPNDAAIPEVGKEKGEKSAILADELWFRYERNGRDVLKACSLKLEQGKVTAVLGGNGTGKSTLLHVLAGNLTAWQGKLKEQAGSVGLLPQNPQAMFVKKTVREELEISATAKSRFGMQEVMKFCDLKEVETQHPFDLSGGQMQKLGLAKLLLADYDIFLLDEPGKGMDYSFKQELGKLLNRLTAMGKTILLVSHDVEFCARYADVCGLFFDGHIVSYSAARTFFLQNVFYTTRVVRICQGLLPQAVVLEDVLQAFSVSGEEPEIKAYTDKQEYLTPVKTVDEVDVKEEAAAKSETTDGSRRKYGISLAIFFLVMPLTIYIGHTLLAQRKYYFISLLLVLEAILSFFLSFEKRKPKIREVMVIALLGAITAAARAAFYMVPHAKPMAALTILSGVGLGGEAGFLVGAMSMLVSNIFFGQGPWTPWQMFALGMLGFLSGIIFKQDSPCTRKKKYAICFFGLISIILVYGGIMNPSSVLLYQENANQEMILAAYVMGFPFDALHAVFTFLFLWLGTEPVLEKLERVRKKIGMK